MRRLGADLEEKHEPRVATSTRAAPTPWSIAYDVNGLPLTPAAIEKLPFVQAVGTVPPSITCSVPVMLPARSEARNAIRLATSSGVDGRPIGMPPSDAMIRRLPSSTPAPSSSPSRLANSTAASVSIQPGETRTTRTPSGDTCLERLLL